MKTIGRICWIIFIISLLTQPGAVDRKRQKRRPRRRVGRRSGHQADIDPALYVPRPPVYDLIGILAGAGDKKRQKPGPRRRVGRRSGYDSDFNEFMNKRYSDMPQRLTNNKPVDEWKFGPNVGYRPYWQWQQSQTATEYALDDTGKDTWRAKSQSLLGQGGDVQLGAQIITDWDVTLKPPPTCNMIFGPKCDLGRHVSEIPSWEYVALEKRTRSCDYLCTPAKKRVGVVCTVDHTGRVYQDMHFCVYEKTNCLNGTAIVQLETNHTAYQWRNVPFVFPPGGWGRVSIRGEFEANIYLADKFPYTGRSYWVALESQPDFLSAFFHYDLMFCDLWPCFVRFPSMSTLNRALYPPPHWMEYTIAWNKYTGYFIMSQPRHPKMWKEFYLEREEPNPWDIKYIDVTSRNDHYPTFIIHDLKIAHKGSCDYRSYYTTSLDTQEVLWQVDESERLFKEHMKYLGINYKGWSQEDGPYVEYKT